MKQEQIEFGFEAEIDRHPATPIEAVIGNTRHKIRRIRPPVKAHGGKYYLAPKIVPVLLSAPSNPTEYCEPCVFGGSVFLAMPRFEREIVGDINPSIVNLWRTLARHETAKALTDRLAEVPYEEASFSGAKCGTAGSPVEAASNTIVASRFSRGGLGKTFAWSTRARGGKPGDANSWDTFRAESLPKIVSRAQGVEVVQQSCCRAVWESRQRVQRLIYADPPYMPDTRTAKQAYGTYEMTPLQHAKLVAALRCHAGPAAISGYRCREYDRWLSDWRRLDFDMPNNSGQTKKKQRRCESLWINW